MKNTSYLKASSSPGRLLLYNNSLASRSVATFLKVMMSAEAGSSSNFFSSHTK